MTTDTTYEAYAKIARQITEVFALLEDGLLETRFKLEGLEKHLVELKFQVSGVGIPAPLSHAPAPETPALEAPAPSTTTNGVAGGNGAAPAAPLATDVLAASAARTSAAALAASKAPAASTTEVADVQAALIRVTKRLGRATALDIVKEFASGPAKLSSIPPDRYSEVLRYCSSVEIQDARASMGS